MGFFAQSRPCRAIALAASLLWFGAADLNAGSLISPGTLDLIRKSAEPFGLLASRVNGGSLREKWLGVERRLDDERVQLALCDGDRERCVSPAALRLLAIVDNARAREIAAWRWSRITFRNYRPLFVIDDSGVMRYQDLPPAILAQEKSALTVAVNLVAKDLTSRSN